MSLPNSFVEILIHTVMVLKGGVLRSCVSHQSGALMSRISALIKETPGTPSPPHSCDSKIFSMVASQALTKSLSHFSDRGTH